MYLYANGLYFILEADFFKTFFVDFTVVLKCRKKKLPSGVEGFANFPNVYTAKPNLIVCWR